MKQQDCLIILHDENITQKNTITMNEETPANQLYLRVPMWIKCNIIQGCVSCPGL